MVTRGESLLRVEKGTRCKSGTVPAAVSPVPPTRGIPGILATVSERKLMGRRFGMGESEDLP